MGRSQSHEWKRRDGDIKDNIGMDMGDDFFRSGESISKSMQNLVFVVVLIEVR
jgi:hypothetical protein